MNKTYKLVNYNQNSKIVNSFKKSILGMDIGVKSDNFLIKITLSTILVIATIIFMYYSWRV